MEKLKLGILDQSIVRMGETAKMALEETIATAKLGESLGFSRFWVSEHHNSKFIAGSSPELLMVKLASETKTIKIGSGGIMLPNHSALKVAENFRMLETLFPGRIDLGMGRAPGTDRITSSFLNPSNHFTEKEYTDQLTHLQHFFKDEAGTQHGALLAVPQSETIPEQWILSSSGGSAKIAAEFGMGLALAKFINGSADPRIVEEYRQNFIPSSYMDVPKVLLSIFVLCGETEEIAAQMRKSQDYIFLQFEKGNVSQFPDQETIKNYQFSPLELERLQYNKGRVISGTQDDVKEQLVRLANHYAVDEIVVSTMADNAAHRRRSFELLAEAFELKV